MEIEVYHTLTDQKTLQQRANDIYLKYFTSESSYELNLPAQLVEEISAEMEKQQAHPQLFEKAQKAVFLMMEQDGWFRWIHTDAYKNYVEGVKERRKKDGDKKGAHAITDENKEDFFKTQMLGMQGNTKKKIFSESTTQLQDMIKRNAPHQGETIESTAALRRESNESGKTMYDAQLIGKRCHSTWRR
jgi:hypothetical protein